MKKTDLDLDNLTFKEEVSEDQLHSKLGVDDHIYVTERRIFGLSLLSFFAAVFVITSLFAIMLGIVFSNSDKVDRPIGIFTSKYNLIVTHANDQYGGTISSFKNYNMQEKSYNYNFGVSNNNDVDLKYSIEIENTNYDFSKLDMSLIDYQLKKNGKIVKSGKLKNAVVNSLYTTSISSNSVDNYVISLWSNSLNKSKDFVFKINVDA